jgi:outer membrane biogenesis lipoprotein LolB
MRYKIVGLVLLVLAGCASTEQQRKIDADVWWRHADAGYWVHHRTVPLEV